MSEKRICPVPGCGAQIERGKLCCKECWYRVPAVLRRRVNATWRAYRASILEPLSREQRLERLRAYREAADAAVKASERFR